MNLKLGTPLSDDELEELDRFPLSDARTDETMLLDTLDGYLTAIVIGPTTILPSQWLPGIRGPSEDDDVPPMSQSRWQCHVCQKGT